MTKLEHSFRKMEVKYQNNSDCTKELADVVTNIALQASTEECEKMISILKQKYEELYDEKWSAVPNEQLEHSLAHLNALLLELTQTKEPEKTLTRLYVAYFGAFYGASNLPHEADNSTASVGKELDKANQEKADAMLSVCCPYNETAYLTYQHKYLAVLLKTARTLIKSDKNLYALHNDFFCSYMELGLELEREYGLAY